MELLKKNIHTERIKSKAFLQIPLETDINVSDAKPDVAKIIYDCGTIKVDEIKTGMNKIWVKGKLCYQILYQTESMLSNDNTLPNDNALSNNKGDKTLAGMDGEIPFMEEIYLDKLEGTDRVICKTNLDDMRIHIINSRKLSIQSVITLEPRVEESIAEELCVELDNTGDADQKLEYRKKSLEFLETIVKKRDLLRIHEETRLPAGMPDIGAALWKNAVISSINFRPMDEKLGITGELSVFIVYREDTSDRTNWYETVIPFNGNVECQNSREGMIADVSYEIGHEEITIREDSDGELRVISVETTVELEIKLYEKESTSIVADVYGVSCEVQAGIDSRQFRDLCTELNIEEKLTRSIKLEDADPKILQVCHSDARAKLAETTIRDGQLKLSGEIELQVLYASNENGGGLCPVRSIVPFEIARDIPDVDEEQLEQYSLSVWIPQQAVSIKDSSQLEWRGSINIKILIYNTKSEDILTELKIESINADVLEKLPGFAIYYVKPGDSLWQIGKKYYVSVGRIKEMNHLTEDEIKAGDKILIVK
ncbi:MAG: DUF3794 domain-containing protein [Lachnospiraceae bacterium]|nr:DUF3794 domain-containing protein [Lachnospiraceae bacterium]MDE7273833.1 DUF3794 domain-containing protein [Lachnospiraceae bacterium]